jgi:cytoskeletal protein RodZ
MPVGEKLAAERRKQGKSLNDVVAATNIMGRHLDSLENGRLDQMPTAVYVRGFIQGYAKYLGIPAAPLLAEYEADLGGKRPRSRLEDVPERTVVPMRDQLHHIPGRTWLAILGTVLVIGFVLWLVGTLGGKDTTPPPIPPATTSSTVEPTETAPGVTTDTVPGTGTVSPTDPASQTPGTAFVLRVTVADGMASWLRVTVDGLKAYEGTLAGGTYKEWTVTQNAEVRIGKATAVTVTRDGQPVQAKSVDGIAVATMSASDE